MNYDKDKVDEVVLALLYLRYTMDAGPGKGWIGMSWIDCTKRGMIRDPKGKAKSVVLTEEGVKRCEELFKKLFGTKQTL